MEQRPTVGPSISQGWGRTFLGQTAARSQKSVRGLQEGGGSYEKDSHTLHKCPDLQDMEVPSPVQILHIRNLRLEKRFTSQEDV